MKASCLLFLLLCGFGQGFAQTPQGVIRYRTTIKLREQLAKQNKILAAMLPEQIDDTSEVLFQGNRFVSFQAGKDESSGAGSGMGFPGTQEKQFFDLSTRSERKEVTLNNRVYATVTTAPVQTKVYYRKETRTIAGYRCWAAIVVKSDKDWYLAWYTPALPYGYNPHSLAMAAVKGAVLGYQTPDITCEAIAVQLKPVPEVQLAPNPKARIVTEEQLSDLTEDAMTPTQKLPVPGSKKDSAASTPIIIRL